MRNLHRMRTPSHHPRQAVHDHRAEWLRGLAQGIFSHREVPMKSSIPVVIPGHEPIEGHHPIVVIGPNGSGKSRLGANLATSNDGARIGALRNIQIANEIGRRALPKVSKELANNLKSSRSKWWQMSSELEILLSKILEEDSQSAVAYRDAKLREEMVEVEQTTRMKLEHLWADFFPGRSLALGDYMPKAKARHLGEETEYPAMQMSDGEKVTLYLAARVLDSKQTLIVVDEPEVHLHTRLAIRFWNALEEKRKDCRFIYLTHNLPFALSRRKAQFVVVQPQREMTILPPDGSLPEETVDALLSAASFSVYAKRIVFCEGTEKEHADHSFYSAWFNDDTTAVVPVGGCEEVIASVTAFRDSPLVTGLDCVGVIDRDYWPDEFFDKLPEGVHVLDLHEWENLLCLDAAFAFVASKVEISQEEALTKYAQAVSAAKRQFTGGLLCKQVSERFRKRCEVLILPKLNSLEMSDNLDELESKQVEAVKNAFAEIVPSQVFWEEKDRVVSSIQSSGQDYLRLLPGKGTLGEMAKSLEISKHRYIAIVVGALRCDSDEQDSADSLVDALQPYLPSRSFT